MKHVSMAQEAASKAKVELELAESKLRLVEGEPVLGDTPGRLKRLKSYADKTKEEESAYESLEANEALLAQAIDEKQLLNSIDGTSR